MTEQNLFGETEFVFCDNRDCPNRNACLRTKVARDAKAVATCRFPLNPDGSCKHLLERKRN